MDFKQSMVVALCSAMLTGGVSLILPDIASAESERRISLKRSNPNEEIGRDGILSHVDTAYPGNRILSVQRKPSAAFPDCHVVRILHKGEYITVKVACS